MEAPQPPMKLSVDARRTVTKHGKKLSRFISPFVLETVAVYISITEGMDNRHSEGQQLHGKVEEAGQFFHVKAMGIYYC